MDRRRRQAFEPTPRPAPPAGFSPDRAGRVLARRLAGAAGDPRGRHLAARRADAALAFMDGNVPRSTALRFLGQFEQVLAAYAGELRADFERSSFQMPLNTGLLAFQSGVEGFEAQLAWARQARARLMEDSQ